MSPEEKRDQDVQVAGVSIGFGSLFALGFMITLACVYGPFKRLKPREHQVGFKDNMENVAQRGIRFTDFEGGSRTFRKILDDVFSTLAIIGGFAPRQAVAAPTHPRHMEVLDDALLLPPPPPPLAQQPDALPPLPQPVYPHQLPPSPLIQAAAADSPFPLPPLPQSPTASPTAPQPAQQAAVQPSLLGQVSAAPPSIPLPAPSLEQAASTASALPLPPPTLGRGAPIPSPQLPRASAFKAPPKKDGPST